jgi:hypothetical protein
LENISRYMYLILYPYVPFLAFDYLQYWLLVMLYHNPQLNILIYTYLTVVGFLFLFFPRRRSIWYVFWVSPAMPEDVFLFP